MGLIRISKHLLYVFVALVAILAVSCKPSADTATDSIQGQELFQTVEKYVALGEHRTGTSTDTATSFWLGQELKSFGYDVKYLDFELREFFPKKTFLSLGKDTIDAFPIWWVNEHISNTVQGNLVNVNSVKSFDSKAIALIHLPLKTAKTVDYIDSLIIHGALGVVAITDNASGEIEAYNTSKDQKPWNAPVILVAPKDSVKIYSLLNKPVTVSIEGEFKDVKSRNVYGKIGNGENHIVISTPISGWFTCGGERGTGVAIWLALAKWASKHDSKYTFVFTGNSGHEHAFFGAHEYLEKEAPSPEKTHLWIHFGAGAATRKYDRVNGKLTAQSIVDSDRKLFYNDAVKVAFDSAFGKVPGVRVLANENPAGELASVARKGYKRFAGVSYVHPYFHVKTDDASTTTPEILEATANAWRNFIITDEQ